MSQQQSNSAHGKAVQALSDARQHVRKYHFELERANVPEDQIFVQEENPNHPQKSAHAALMDFYQEINQAEYILMFDDIWKGKISDAAGNPITVAVPASDRVTKTVNERTGVDNMVPSFADIDTREETVSLESLAHKWAGRTITVRAEIDSPYHASDTMTKTVRMWLPPKLIKAAYSSLNDCLSKVGLLAKTSAPIEKDPDPI
jgi:hypothetical protein